MPWLSEFDIRQIDDTNFKLLAPLKFVSVKYNVEISAPVGFVSNGPSVGRWPVVFWLFGKKGKRAAVIHDWLYTCRLLSRKISDDIYKEALEDSGYTKSAAFMHPAVRLCGGKHYNTGIPSWCLDTTYDCKNRTAPLCAICDKFHPNYKETVVWLK